MEWKNVEKNLSDTINFLKNNILLSPYHQNNPIKCNDCLFRLISILIASGKAKVNKIKYKHNNIWAHSKTKLNTNNRKLHGAKWHSKMMLLIENYFQYNNYNVQNESNLYYGKSDLYIPVLNIYIEVGTISLYKLYNNLLNMRNCKIIIVPSENYLIEFII